MAKRSDQHSRGRGPLVTGLGVVLMLSLAACGPLGSDDEPTATTSAPVGRATTSTSLAASPTPNASFSTPAASPPAPSTPAVTEPSATPVLETPIVDEATPAANASPEATPESVDDATPQADEAPDTVVESCSPDAIPAFEGDDPDYTVVADLNFRDGPGEDCDLVIDEPLGEGREVVVLSEPVTREGEDQEWVQIEVDGEAGWVAAEFIAPVDA